jgi:hypothetical protein
VPGEGRDGSDEPDVEGIGEDEGDDELPGAGDEPGAGEGLGIGEPLLPLEPLESLEGLLGELGELGELGDDGDPPEELVLQPAAISITPRSDAAVNAGASRAPARWVMSVIGQCLW